MSSERLYYTDAYLMEFDAVVRDVAAEGDRWAVTLDRTAFYPTSGGQPYDVGTLGEAQVLEVAEREEAGIVHLVDRQVEKHSRVRGHIDWTRRFDHMQQHSGQHLLSAAFDREVGARTVSFHLGASASTIDLDKDLPADAIARVETTANRVLWEDREVCVKFVSESEAAKLPLRKDPGRSGDLRIVEIDDYDLSACGGTHVRRTGGIGLIAVVGAERVKSGTRVEFVCGDRALRAHRALRASVAGSVRLLSVVPDELPAGIEKLQAASRALQRSQEALQGRLAAHEASRLAARGEAIGRVTLVAAAPPDWDLAGIKHLASAIAATPGTVAVLVTAAPPPALVVARAADVPLDAGVVLKGLLERFGGKGGGRGAMAQGGGLSGDPQAIVAAAREFVSAALEG